MNTCAPAISYCPLVTMGRAWKQQPIRKARSRMSNTSLEHHQRPPKVPYPKLNKCQYNVLLAWESGEKIYEPHSVLEADAPVTFPTYDGWKRHKNLAKSEKHNLSSLAPQKGEMKSSFSWTSLFKSPTSSTLWVSQPTLGKL